MRAALAGRGPAGRRARRPLGGESALARARRALGRIRRADELAADLDEARGLVLGLPPVVLPVDAADLVAELRKEPRETVDPERQADLVVAARAQRPDDSVLLSALGQVGRTLKLGDTAAEPQWSRVRRAPNDQRAALSLLETLLQDNDTAGVRVLVRTLTDAALAPSTPN
ncbi:hypothetical protein ACFQXA_14655 [Nocardiopsis composta]